MGALTAITASKFVKTSCESDQWYAISLGWAAYLPVYLFGHGHSGVAEGHLASIKQKRFVPNIIALSYVL